MSLSLQNVDRIVGGEYHLKGIDLSFEEGSRNVLLGRTLAGKTSILRIMAGLDRPTKGHVLVDGEDVTGRPVQKRNVAMVYQQFVNYPSLTIYDNIASPLKIAGYPKKDIEQKVHEVAEILHIDHLLDRLPAELSGGQQQRTAIARSLAKDSKLLLLDEPLVNLDYKLREELRSELKTIFAKGKAIVVYTTTEPAEALMLGGNIIVIDEGRILQKGETANVYHHPASLKVAEVFSDPPINRVTGKIEASQFSIGSQVEAPLVDHMQQLPNGLYQFGIHSNHLFLKRKNDNDIEIRAQVDLSEINGSETFTHIQFEDHSIVVQNEGIHSFKIGMEISVYVNPDLFFIFDSNGDLVASPNPRTA